MEEKTIEQEDSLLNGFDNDILDINLDDIEDEHSEEESKAEESHEDVKQEESKAEEESHEEETKKSEESKPSESTESDQKKEEVEEKSQSKETNSYFAELRRKKEAQKKEQEENEARIKREKEIKEQAKLEAELGILKKNPYTEEAITDAEDLRIYKIQKAIEEKGGDPIADLGKEMARISREERIQAKAKADAEAKQKNEDDERAKNDVANFVSKYPNVNTSDLINDTDFVNFANDKFGRWTLEEIYLAFNEKKESKQRESKKEETDKKTKPIVEDASKKISKVPSSKANGNPHDEFDWMSMSDEEYLKRDSRKDDYQW